MDREGPKQTENVPADLGLLCPYAQRAHLYQVQLK